MASPGVAAALLLLLLVSLPATLAAEKPSSSSGTTVPTSINSNSVLVALLDSHYTMMAELVEKALLLQTLEEAVGRHNLTILAPRNEALERELDPGFKRFLLEPGNVRSLQTLLLHHVIPFRLPAAQWAESEYPTLSGDRVRVTVPAGGGGVIRVDDVGEVVHADAVSRPDGVIHGIDRLLVPHSVQADFNRRRSMAEISAVLPEGAPEVDPRTNRLKHPVSVPVGAPPALPVYYAMAPGPGLAPAPAPGPGGAKRWFDGEEQVKDFIHTLLHYGGYNELADILVNLTSLASEMGRLVSEGYVLTVLAPNDDAMGKLTAEQLSEPGAPEQIMYYHMIPEYQTEESMYNAVRRFGRVNYDTLRLPHRVVAREADGSVRFGHGDSTAYLFDPDIYTDGRISVQGVDSVLFPPDQLPSPDKTTEKKPVDRKVVTTPPRRGKLLEMACRMLSTFGQDSRFQSCY